MRGGKSEIFVIAEGKFAAPGVEELHGGCASGDLGFEIGDGGLRDAMEKRSEGGGLVEQEGFCAGKAFAGAAFDHVAGESPGASGETENRDGRADFTDDSADRFGEEGGFDFGIEEF